MGIVILWAIFALVAWAIGSSKGRAGLGLFLGLMLGLIGVILIAVIPANQAVYTAKPGWYPDPEDDQTPPAQRYFDGKRWAPRVKR